MASNKTKAKQKFNWKEFKRQKVLMFWAALFVIYGVVFYYLPLGGWIMAFQDYKPKDGLLHSAFVGLAKFKQLFSDATFIRVIRNTLAMGVLNLVFTFVMAIVFAEFLPNEVHSIRARNLYKQFLTCHISFPGLLLQVFFVIFFQEQEL